MKTGQLLWTAKFADLDFDLERLARRLLLGSPIWISFLAARDRVRLALM